MSQAKTVNPNRLYFGNIAFQKTQEEIQQFFTQCGAVEDVYLVKDKFTQRFQGYGFITFADEEGKEACLKLNGTEFDGRPVKINLETRQSDKTRSQQRIFIKNIPADKTEDEVKQAFAHCGTVTDFFFVKDRVTKIPKGFGFMDFSTSEEAKEALSMDGQDPFGTGGLSVKIAHQKKPVPPSYGPAFGMGYGQQYNPYGAGGYGAPPPWQGGYGGFGGRGRGRGRGRGGRGRGRGNFGGPPPQANYGAYGGAPSYGAPQGGAYGGAPAGGYGGAQGGAYGGAPAGGAYGGQQW